MDGRFSRPNRSSRNSGRVAESDTRAVKRGTPGFTLVELLIGFAVAMVLVAGAMSIALSSRNMMTTDEKRTRLNQSLRGTLDLLGIDIRQTGERLPGDFPAIEIVNGVDGAPDTLILRRNLLDEVLPLCETLEQDLVADEVLVAAAGTQGCAPVADDDGDGWPDNIGAWRDWRNAGGGQAPVYVYNPVSRSGEWFVFDDDGSTSHHLHKGNDDPWQTTYEVDQQGRVYMLEQRSYRVTDGLLLFTRDMSADDAIHVSANVTDFQARAVMADGSILDTLDSNDEWTALRAIEVTIEASTGTGDESMTRALSARFFPRNILSN